MGLLRPKPRVDVWTRTADHITTFWYRNSCEFELAESSASGEGEKVLRLQVIPHPQSGLEAIEIPYDQLLELMEEIRE